MESSGLRKNTTPRNPGPQGNPAKRSDFGKSIFADFFCGKEKACQRVLKASANPQILRVRRMKMEAAQRSVVLDRKTV